MDKKSYLWGILTGVILTFLASFIINRTIGSLVDSDPIEYLDEPLSYENKTETSFKVFQVLGAAALANEVSNKKYNWYNGNIVLILGENYYCDQVITVKNPKRVGTYSYTTKNDRPLTVPVIDGEME